MAMDAAAYLQLEPLESLMREPLASKSDHRYERMLKGLALLSSEFTQLLASLQVHVTEDLEFIMGERAALLLERTALHAEKDNAIVVAKAAPKELSTSREVDALHAEKDNTLIVARAAPKEGSTSREVDATLETSTTNEWQALAASHQELVFGKRSQEKNPVAIPERLPQVSCQSEGQLPAWLSASQVSQLPMKATSALRTGSSQSQPERQRPHVTTDIRTENDARAAAQRREWLVARGEEAHRFMMKRRETSDTSNETNKESSEAGAHCPRISFLDNSSAGSCDSLPEESSFLHVPPIAGSCDPRSLSRDSLPPISEPEETCSPGEAGVSSEDL